MDCDSLLGRFADCARRCLILSTEDTVVLRPGDSFGVLLGNVDASALKLVGVGGVTKVVGVSVRFGGVSGSDAVLMLGLPRFFGVTGRSSLLAGCS